MTPSERERAELKAAIAQRDELAEQHFQLDGEHANLGTVNCTCELAKRQRTVVETIEGLLRKKYASKLTVNELVQAARREERKRWEKLLSRAIDLIEPLIETNSVSPPDWDAEAKLWLADLDKETA